jgi:hypothetical protein
MLSYWTALQLDAAEHHPDASRRRALHEQVSLITPIVKALFSDQGFQSTSLALQVFGGHGYICETGIEQYMRDIRVMMLYEGTNEIQAVDLLVRKVLGDGVERLGMFLAMIEDFARGQAEGSHVVRAKMVQELVQQTGTAARSIASAAASDPALPYRIAGEMLHLVGHCALAWMWLRATEASVRNEAGDPAFHKAKQETAHYYFTYLLPETCRLLAVVDACLHDAGAASEPGIA